MTLKQNSKTKQIPRQNKTCILLVFQLVNLGGSKLLKPNYFQCSLVDSSTNTVISAVLLWEVYWYSTEWLPSQAKDEKKLLDHFARGIILFIFLWKWPAYTNIAHPHFIPINWGKIGKEGALKHHIPLQKNSSAFCTFFLVGYHCPSPEF